MARAAVVRRTGCSRPVEEAVAVVAVGPLSLALRPER